MYSCGSKKTKAINAFELRKIVKPRDLYARYGFRASTRGISSTDETTPTTVAPSGSAVIESMIVGQESIKSSLEAKKMCDGA